jgi:hypothetical protein
MGRPVLLLQLVPLDESQADSASCLAQLVPLVTLFVGAHQRVLPLKN